MTKVGSSDLEMGTGMIHELDKPAYGMWRFPRTPELCCIYRVPNSMRHVNPVAYTPELVLIGPLHHSLKSEALKSRGDITNTKSMGYLKMERHKKVYLAAFSRRFSKANVVDGLRRIIENNEEKIRESYSESTDWIQSTEFVDMMLHDSVFILEFILRFHARIQIPSVKTGDPLMDELCLQVSVKRDLKLLENQIPYFILDQLFEPLFGFLVDPRFRSKVPNLCTLITCFFGFRNEINDNYSKFKHFTDLERCARVETLPEKFLGDFEEMDELYHAEKLYNGGVKLNAVNKELSLEVEFKNGCLHIPCFVIDGHSEVTLRNIMALEQCHYASQTHVCNYISFMDFLIDTEKDVELLVEKGIIKHMIGNHDSVATMVNNLCVGVVSFGSYYSVIAQDIKQHYDNSYNRSCTVLKSVYFSNMWRGTSTIAAGVLLLMTLIQAVSSIIQILQKDTPAPVMTPP